MSGPRTTASRATTAVAALLLTVATAAAYSNSFTTIFAGADAKESIRDNLHIRSLWPLTDAMSLPLLEQTLAEDPDAKGGTVVRRPMLSLSFAATRALFGSEPRGFHAVNLAIHLAAALALFGLARRTLLLPWAGGRYEDRAHWLALALAALWLVHPLQTESVTNLVQRAESQMGLLYLLTLYCALRGFSADRSAAWFAGSIAACALGMGTKETMVTAPVVVALYDRTFVSATLGRALRSHAVLYLGLAAGWTVLAWLLWMTLGDVSSDFGTDSNLSYALAQPGVLCHYLRLAVWPIPLYVYVSTQSFDVESISQAVAPALALVALVVATLWGWATRRRLAFAGVWFFAILAPTSSIVATSDVIQEHRMYLALAAIIAVAVLAGDRFARTRSPVVSRVLAGVVAVVVLASIGLTRDRNRDYHDEFSMIHPADLHEQYMILARHSLRGDLIEDARSEARARLAEPAADPREHVFANFYLGVAWAEQEELGKAEPYLADAVRLDDDFAYAHRELCSVLRRRGDLDRAAEHCRRAVVLKHEYPEGHNEMGMVLAARGNPTAARHHFDQALRLWPDYADAHFERGVLLADLGETDAAAAEFEAALRLVPDYPQARGRLADLDRIDAGGDGM